MDGEENREKKKGNGEYEGEWVMGRMWMRGLIKSGEL